MGDVAAGVHAPVWSVPQADAVTDARGAGPTDTARSLDLEDGPVVALPAAPLLGARAWDQAVSTAERERFDEAHAQLDNPPAFGSPQEVWEGVSGKLERATACPAKGSTDSVLRCRARFRKERSRLELGRLYLGFSAPVYLMTNRLYARADAALWQTGRPGQERTRFNDAHDLIDRGRPLNDVRLVACDRTNNACWERFTGERMRLELVRDARAHRGDYARFDELGHQRALVRTIETAATTARTTSANTTTDPEPMSTAAASSLMRVPGRLFAFLKGRETAPAPVRTVEIIDLDRRPTTPNDPTPPATPDGVTLEQVQALLAEENAADRQQFEELMASLGRERGWLASLWDTVASWFGDDGDGPTVGAPVGAAPLLLPEHAGDAVAGAGPEEDAGEGVDSNGGGFFGFLGRTQDKVASTVKWVAVIAAILGVGWLIAVAVIGPCP